MVVWHFRHAKLEDLDFTWSILIRNTGQLIKYCLNGKLILSASLKAIPKQRTAQENLQLSFHIDCKMSAKHYIFQSS